MIVAILYYSNYRAVIATIRLIAVITPIGVLSIVNHIVTGILV